ncbi:dTMP kinase [Candidatus Nanopelagicales bacterium]|nr:dTMP kinase [Candidatus Nanopelagicales bacterium]
MTQPKADGFFVVFEGGEGSGKSTQVQELAARLRSLGYQVVTTREPGGTPIAEQIRALVLAHHNAEMGARCEALLFAAARAEHVEKTIRPALERGAVVISDRFVESSIAYQGAGRGLGMTDVADVSAWAIQGVQPDLTILLDVAPEIGLARAQDPNRLEAESLTFHLTLRAALLELAKADPSSHVIVAGQQSQEQVAEQIWAATQARLPSPSESVVNAQ